MKYGVILTAAPSWEWVLEHVPPNIDTIKVVPAWGLHWDRRLRQAVFDRFETVIVRTACGDLSYSDGSLLMPEAHKVEAEIAPWYEAWNKKSRLIVQIGNEPLLQPVGNEMIAWQYAWHVNDARRMIVEQFKLETMSYAHMINHWVMLNGRKDGQRRWTEIAHSALRLFDLLGVNAYTKEQVELGIALYRELGLSQPIWLSEFNLNETLTPSERAVAFFRTLEPFRTSIQGVTVYHLVHNPDDHPVHSNKNYTIQRETLAAWKQEESVMTQSPTGAVWVGMTREHFFKGRTNPIRCLVVHATAGRFPGDYDWLRAGGHPTDKNRFVSIHYYIKKDGAILQMVKDEDRAWHAGESAWVIDGTRRTSLNNWSIGIELENANDGKDPYPKAQVDACVKLSKHLTRTYNIPASQVVAHYHISPGRKSDPAGFAWQSFIDSVFDDHWSAWGTKFPLSVDQRGWSIPQAWRSRRNDLGAAASYEYYVTPTVSVQVFEKGCIVFHSVTKACTVVVF